MKKIAIVFALLLLLVLPFTLGASAMQTTANGSTAETTAEPYSILPSIKDVNIDGSEDTDSSIANETTAEPYSIIPTVNGGDENKPGGSSAGTTAEPYSILPSTTAVSIVNTGITDSSSLTATVMIVALAFFISSWIALAVIRKKSK